MANSDFKITTEQIEQTGRTPVTVLSLRGWLDAQGEGQLVKTAEDSKQNGTKHLIIDLSDVELVTSAGIRAMQKVYKLFMSSDQSQTASTLKLCNAQPQVYRVLALTGFLQSVLMYETLKSALSSYEN